MKNDTFQILAPYYDRIMTRVRYDRWESRLLDLQKIIYNSSNNPVYHLDVACGTGTLIQKLSKHGWYSIGIDISPAMLYIAKQVYPDICVLTGDMCSLPFVNSFQIISCLFDSINFLLDEEDVYRSIYSMALSLQKNGIIYFDCVTEQMVRQYYNDSQWKENYKEFKTFWESTYNPATKTATLSILVHGKGWSVVRQKIHPLDVYLDAIKEAGLTLLACVDAHTWDHIDSGTVRIDFLCSRYPSDFLIHNFKQIHDKIKIESQLSLRND